MIFAHMFKNYCGNHHVSYHGAVPTINEGNIQEATPASPSHSVGMYTLTDREHT